MEKATFAGGCFWCTEAVFNNLKGVNNVVSGYTGGETSDPAYEVVSTGNTGHAEAIQITFDPKIISYSDLLRIFWVTHEPTTKDRQGPDVGTQYRSVVFYHDKEQKKQAEEVKNEAQKLYDSLIVTEIVSFKKFFKAENYHQDYYSKNSKAFYCKIVIDPKIRKLQKNFKKLLK